jgi:hypothetical protein
VIGVEAEKSPDFGLAKIVFDRKVFRLQAYKDLIGDCCYI